jgi:hypothetical protein
MTGEMISGVIDEVEVDAPVSLAWARLIAAGPIQFDHSDHSESTEVAA